VDGTREGCAGRASDGQGVSSCFLWRYVEAAVVRRPDFRDRGFEGDGLGIGDVVAELGALAGLDDGGGDVEGANGEF